MIHRPARVVSGALIARPSRTCGALHSTACRPHRQPRHYSERALLVERPCPCLEVVSVVALLAHYAHCLQVSACQAAAISLNRLITTSLQALSARLERAQIRPIRRESSHTLNGDYMSSALRSYILYARVQPKRPRTHCTHTVWTGGREVSTARRGHLTVRACGKRRHPFYATRRARCGPLVMPLPPPGRPLQPFLSWIATATRLRMHGKKRVSGLSRHAHAVKELLLYRQRFEQDHRGYLRLHAGA